MSTDVATQSNVPGWTLQKWADYFDTEPAKRDKIRNVISLEISGTELADNILPPRLVREVDWVEKFWPSRTRVQFIFNTLLKVAFISSSIWGKEERGGNDR